MLPLRDILILLGILLTLTYFFFTRNFNYWKSRSVPHEKPVVFFGNLLDIAIKGETPGKYVGRLYHKFKGPYFGFYALNRPMLVLKDPELIKRVLIKDFEVFQNRSFVSDETIDPLTSNILFAIRSPYWRPLRSKISPVFTSGKMKKMFCLMTECGINLERYITTILNSDTEAKELAAKYTTDVIATCVFGIAANSFIGENNEFRQAARQIFERDFISNLRAISYFLAPGLVKFFRFRFFCENQVGFLRNVFMKTINQREISKVKRNDLIDVLIELKNKESKDDEYKFYGDRLLAQAFMFFLAGHETTSSTIGFTLHELCLNTEIQDCLRKEIFDVINKYGDLNYDAVQNMKYLDMIISETLRKYPLLAFLTRECSENYKIPETGLVLEKGTSVIIPQHGLQWDPKYFPDPEKYDPERFNDANKQKITSHVYMPFGDGPRICIGERFGLLTAKLGIIYILRSFKVERNWKTEKSLKFTPSGLLQAKGGIRMTFKQL